MTCSPESMHSSPPQKTCTPALPRRAVFAHCLVVLRSLEQPTNEDLMGSFSYSLYQSAGNKIPALPDVSPIVTGTMTLPLPSLPQSVLPPSRLSPTPPANIFCGIYIQH
eukprot:scaffold44313_cov20-Tisochrysis_lutea.AAC.2